MRRFKKIFRYLKLSTFKKITSTKEETVLVKLILNPMAGKGWVKKTMGEIKEAFKEMNPNIKLCTFISGDAGEATEAARDAAEKDLPLVIVAGGDGAINEVINGLAGTDVKVGIIPLGTGNIFSREMKIPLDIYSACELIAKGKEKRVDLGKAGDRYFIWLAGIGADALISKEVNWEVKDKLGTLAYFIFTFRHIKDIRRNFNKLQFDFEMALDGEKVIKDRALMIQIGNAATYKGGEYAVNSLESMNDGFLDICVWKKVSTTWIIRQSIGFIFGMRLYYKALRFLKVKNYKAKKIEIKTTPPTPIHIDGEFFGETPIEFNIVPKSLSLILPEKENKKL